MTQEEKWAIVERVAKEVNEPFVMVGKILKAALKGGESSD